MTSVLLTFPDRCLGRGKSPRRFSADVAVKDAEDEETQEVGKVEYEEEAVGRPKDGNGADRQDEDAEEAVGRVEDEEEAVGRTEDEVGPEDEAVWRTEDEVGPKSVPTPAAVSTEPDDDEPNGMTNDANDRGDVDDLRCCCSCGRGSWDCPFFFPFPFSAAARRAGPRAAKSRPPVCCMRPAHMQSTGGSWWAFMQIAERMTPRRSLGLAPRGRPWDVDQFVRHLHSLLLQSAQRVAVEVEGSG